MGSLELARSIMEMIADKKGEDVLLLDIREISILADFFVIGTTASERQARAVLDDIRQGAKQALGVLPLRVEGEPASGWVLMDYGDVVVHLFSPEVRTYYNLEELWKEGRVLVRML